jgi:leucyl/phenylalanyl-tRNA--protein transferase
MTGIGPFWIDPNDSRAKFPDVSLALREPNGLLAVGGDLTPRRLITAYMQGIFPWYSQGQPILWWSPDPRAVLFPHRIKVTRSMRKVFRNGGFEVTFDRAFRDVLAACAQPRANSQGTWITAEIADAYLHLHRLGLAHSVEAWKNGKLVGGLYGVAIGRVFFGESMFSRVANASKIAFISLVHQLEAWDFAVIDCQIQSDHLRSLGSEDIPRAKFVSILKRDCRMHADRKKWSLDFDFVSSLYAPDTDDAGTD